MSDSFANILYCLRIVHAFISLLTFFKIKFLQINHQEPLSECQTNWIQINADILLSFSGFKLFAKAIDRGQYSLLACKEFITGKYLTAQGVAFNLDIHVYVYQKYSDTLNIFLHVLPFKQSYSNVQRI